MLNHDFQDVQAEVDYRRDELRRTVAASRAWRRRRWMRNGDIPDEERDPAGRG